MDSKNEKLIKVKRLLQKHLGDDVLFSIMIFENEGNGVYGYIHEHNFNELILQQALIKLAEEIQKDFENSDDESFLN